MIYQSYYNDMSIKIDDMIDDNNFDILIDDNLKTNLDIFIREKKLKYIETL